MSRLCRRAIIRNYGEITTPQDAMMVVGKRSDIDDVVEAFRLKFIKRDMGRVRHLLSMGFTINQV